MSLVERLSPHIILLEKKINPKTIFVIEASSYQIEYSKYFKTDIDQDGVLQSEDWVFCNQYRDVGGKIWLNPTIKLDHIGTYIYEGDIQQVGANIT